MGPDRLLQAARRRLAWQRALHAGEAAAVWLLLAALGAQLGTLVLPYSARLEWAFLVVTSGAGVVALATRLLVRPTALEAAHWLDRRCALQDRMATYVAVGGAGPSRLLDHFLRDVHRAAAEVRLREAIPLRPARARAVLALAACAVAWDLLVSGSTLPNTPARRVAEVVRQEGRRLQDLAREWEREARWRGWREALRSARNVQQGAGALASPRTTPELARRELSRLAAEVKAARGRLRAQAQEQGAPPGPEGSQVPPWTVRALERELAGLGRALEEVSLSAEQAERVLRALTRLEATSPLRPEAAAHAALREARRKLRAQDRAGAREAVGRAEEAFRELARLLEEEGMLAKHQQEVEASSLSIGQALQGAADPEAAQERPIRYPNIPRNRPGTPGDRRDSEAWSWEGPQSGLEPGVGQVPEKIGPPTPRLRAQRRPEHLQGQPGEGKVYVGRLRAPAAGGEPRTRVAGIPARLVRQVDDVLRAQRVPAPYRDWVRQYFAELAGLGP
ncbi:MAG: hypothetical protein ACK45F_02990 [bacterium]